MTIPPEDVVLSKMAESIKYHISAEYSAEGVMTVNLSEEKLLKVLSTMAETFSNIYATQTGLPRNPLKIDKIIVTLGDYRLEAKEDFEIKHLQESQGFKKCIQEQ
jgi:hypothetical protein